MGRPLPILLAASLSLFAAPALAEEEPPPATTPPAPPPSSSAPAYSARDYSAPARDYSAPAPDGALAPAPEGLDAPRAAPTERLRPGMMATGIAFVAIGVTAMGAGTIAYATRIRDCGGIDFNGNRPAFARCPDDSIQYGSMAFLIAGGAIAAFGIPLWIFGSSSVPASPAKLAASAPTLLVGPRGAALRVSF